MRQQPGGRFGGEIALEGYKYGCDGLPPPAAAAKAEAAERPPPPPVGALLLPSPLRRREQRLAQCGGRLLHGLPRGGLHLRGHGHRGRCRTAQAAGDAAEERGRGGGGRPGAAGRRRGARAAAAAAAAGDGAALLHLLHHQQALLHTQKLLKVRAQSKSARSNRTNHGRLNPLQIFSRTRYVCVHEYALLCVPCLYTMMDPTCLSRWHRNSEGL